MSKSDPTSGDVARLAKVSQSAVSRTFTPGASVSADTRDRVLRAARELGYRPNALARAMISGRSRLIALLVAYLDNQFYPIVVEQLSRRLQDKGRPKQRQKVPPLPKRIPSGSESSINIIIFIIYVNTRI